MKPKKETKQVVLLSLGGGIQSTALALGLHEGLFEHWPTPDAAIFADTGAEPPWVYETVRTLAETVSFPVVTTGAGLLEQDVKAMLDREPTSRRRAQTAESIFFDIPTYIGDRRPGKPTTRRCTGNYKIEPIRQEIRTLFGWPVQVSQYLGISTDEIVRVTESKVKYITNEYPLIDQRWTRADCLEYMTKNWPAIPVGRSSCYFCPYHSEAEWMNIAEKAPELYEKACELDARLAALNPPQYLHRDSDLRKLLERSKLQSKLPLAVKGEECTGHCFT